MEEQIISFETANLSKEKGFDVRCIFMYDRNGAVQRTPSIKHIVAKGGFKALKTPPQLFAPTQSFLQKYIREMHGIEIELYRTLGGGSTTYGVQGIKWVESSKSTFGIFSEDLFNHYEDSYEKALEKGLIEALKSIKL